MAVHVDERLLRRVPEDRSPSELGRRVDLVSKNSELTHLILIKRAPDVAREPPSDPLGRCEAAVPDVAVLHLDAARQAQLHLVLALQLVVIGEPSSTRISICHLVVLLVQVAPVIQGQPVEDTLHETSTPWRTHRGCEDRGL